MLFSSFYTHNELVILNQKFILILSLTPYDVKSSRLSIQRDCRNRLKRNRFVLPLRYHLLLPLPWIFRADTAK